MMSPAGFPFRAERPAAIRRLVQDMLLFRSSFDDVAVSAFILAGAETL
jgi:hypothetical protein